MPGRGVSLRRVVFGRDTVGIIPGGGRIGCRPVA
jgi:hypothetical protein